MTGPEIARMLFNRDGYVVMGTNETYETGDVIRDEQLEKTSQTPGPFVVIGPATREDAQRQMNMLPPEVRWPLHIWTRKVHFYKVTAE